MQKKVILFQVDLYTRILLTIIAFCLLGSLLKPLFSILPAEAELKQQKQDNKQQEPKGGLQKQIQDVNIALINGQPPEMAMPLRVNIARARTLGVKIEDSATLPVAIEKSETLPVSIEKPDSLAVNIVKSDVLPVNITAPDVFDTRIIDSITMPVQITAPIPVPVVQTTRRYRPAAEE
jgi:hypothetical protein